MKHAYMVFLSSLMCNAVTKKIIMMMTSKPSAEGENPYGRNGGAVTRSGWQGREDRKV